MAEFIVTKEYLHERFDYNPDTGIFTWKKSGHGKRNGQIAGCLCKYKHYAVVNLNKKTLYLHRLAWIYMHGSIEKNMVIDHINGKRSDNRICNLRMVTFKENSLNQNYHRAEPRNGKNGKPSKLSVFLSKQSNSVL